MELKGSKNVVHEILFNIQEDIYMLKPSIYEHCECTHDDQDNSEWLLSYYWYTIT
jgi:hypothetical protein